MESKVSAEFTVSTRPYTGCTVKKLISGMNTVRLDESSDLASRGVEHSSKLETHIPHLMAITGQNSDWKYITCDQHLILILIFNYAIDSPPRYEHCQHLPLQYSLAAASYFLQFT